MIKKISLIIIILLVSVQISSAQESTKEITDELNGTWIWDYTEICQRSNPPDLTPQTEGYIVNLVFNSGEVTLQRNGSVIKSSKFDIVKFDNGFEEVYFYFNSDIYTGVIIIKKDKLTISTCRGDGVKRVFTRVKNSHHKTKNKPH